MDKKSIFSSSIVLLGYIFSLAFYFIWCFFFFYGMSYRNDYLLVIAIVVFAITAVYLFSLLLISYIKSFQKVWTSFLLVSITTLLIFFLIPFTNSLIYSMSIDNKLNLERDKPIETIEKNKKEIKILAPNNIKTNKQLEDAKEKIQKEQKRIEKIVPKSGENVLVKGKSNRGSPEIKINSKADKTDLGSKQEIIFKVQVISLSTRLAKNSPQFKRFEGVWEYKDGGLYKYTIGNQKDLKSADALQAELRKKGFSDAFVVAFKNGKRIPVGEAKNLLKVYK